MILGVSITRTSLPGALPPLAIGPGWTASNLRIDADEIARPDIRRRRKYLPDADNIHGSELYSAAKEQASITVPVLGRGTTRAELDAAFDALEAALGQFHFETTQNIDGIETTWSCDAGDIAYGRSKAKLHARYLSAVVTIPCYPTPA